MNDNLKSRIMEETIGWIKTIAEALLVAWILTHLILVNAVVPSGSMENTIEPGDRLFGSRLAYVKSEPQRGDIIIFKYPVNEDLLERLKGSEYREFRRENDVKKVNYIKRLIGLPGETIEIRKGKIYVNGSDEPLDEPYLKEKWVVENDGYEFEVPENCYLMMGDNRNNSSDCRYWANEAYNLAAEAGKPMSADEALALSFVRRDQLVGKAELRYWPLNEISLLR